MNSIKTIQNDIPNLKNFLSQNDLETISNFFLNFINFNNSKYGIDILINLLRESKIQDEKIVYNKIIP
jgi:hypothetical protein